MDDRLPDLMFSRWPEDAEAEGDCWIMGTIISDIDKRRCLDGEDHEAIGEFIETIADLVRGDPELDEAGFWRHHRRPDALAPPYPDDLVNRRMLSCRVFVFCIQPDLDLKITEVEEEDDGPDDETLH